MKEWVRFQVFILVVCCSVLARAQKETRYLNLGDHHIYYEVSGEGPAVVLIHGGYLSLSIWKEQVSYLNRHGFQTIAFDDLGHGLTSRGTKELFGYQIIEALRERHKLEKVSIIGLSWGAMLALDYALHMPDKVHKLILISPGRNGWNYFQDPKAQENFDRRQQARASNDQESFVEYFQRNWTYGPGQSAERLPKRVRQPIAEILKATVKAHWGEDWSEVSQKKEWDTLDAQTLILTGELDALDIREIAILYEREIPNCTWKELPKVGHTLVAERPGRVNRMLRAFLRQ